MSVNAFNAVNILKEKFNINVKCIKINKIKPIDDSILEILLKCDKIHFFEESAKNAGVGEITASALVEKGYKGYYKITAVEDDFVPHAAVSRLMEMYSLSTEKMVEMIRGQNDVG